MDAENVETPLGLLVKELRIANRLKALQLTNDGVPQKAIVGAMK